MLKNYLKIALRSLSKNWMFVTINILGLGIAIACCIVAYLNWQYNAKFDSIHENRDHLFRVNFIRNTNGRAVANGSCPMPLGEHIRESISQIDQVVRYYPVGGNFRVGDDLFRTTISAVDPTFFEAFTFKFIAGDPGQIGELRSILISDLLVEKYFPDNPNPIGETLTYIDGETRVDYVVAAIFEHPVQNSSFWDPEAYVHFDNLMEMTGWEETNWALFNTTFVALNDPADAPAVENQLQQYVEIQNRAKEDYKVARFYLDPFDGLAVRAEKEDVWNHWLQQSLPSAAASAPGIMALLILLIACFNFTNTSIAIANRRIKEIGIRKVLGSTKKQLITQFMAENVFMTFLALLVGLLIAALLVPKYSAMWDFLDIRLNLAENYTLLGFMVVLLLFAGLMAGSYPALYVSSFRPTIIFQRRVRFGGTNLLTRILLTLQFAISLIAIIAAFVFSNNAKFQNEYDMGFDMQSVVYAFVKDDAGYRAMRNEMAGYSEVVAMAGSRHSVTRSWYTDPIKYEAIETDVDLLDIGSGYLDVIGATIVEGRDFMDKSQTDVERSAIINQELARLMGWEDPIGKRFLLRDTIELFVVGVVRDIYIDGALWNPLDPMVMRYVQEPAFRYLSVRANVSDLTKVKSVMDEKWKEIFPEELSTVTFMEQERGNSALVNTNIRTLFLFLGAVAIILSVIGLFSLVSLNINKRLKELGVRKVLGASLGHLVLKISREFMIILLIAGVLGSTAGYFLSDALMSSIWSIYVPIGISVLVISLLIMLVASGLTIGGRVIRAASVNPADILRDE